MGYPRRATVGQLGRLPVWRRSRSPTLLDEAHDLHPEASSRRVRRLCWGDFSGGSENLRSWKADVRGARSQFRNRSKLLRMKQAERNPYVP